MQDLNPVYFVLGSPLLAAAVLALIPLAREVFWAPMALAMMGGLIAATVLTLTFLPALYALAFRVALQPGRIARSRLGVFSELAASRPRG